MINVKSELRVVSDIEEHLDLGKPIARNLYQSHINRYIFAGKFVQNKVVLDIGCGSGAGIKYWVSKGAKGIVGMDISQNAIRDAKSWNSGIRGVSFINADAQALPLLNKTFDVVVALEVIEHLKDADLFLRECSRILKLNGTFICSTPNKRIVSPLHRKPRNPYHIKEWNSQEFSELISRYFTNVVRYEQRMLTLKKRVKPELIRIVDSMLIKVMGRGSLRAHLLSLSKPFTSQPCYPQFREDFEEMADKDYEVVRVGHSQSGIPETLVVVAKILPMEA